MGLSAAQYIAGPLGSLLNRLMALPVMQRGRVYPADNRVVFTYKNWVSDPEEVFVNGIFADSGYTVDRTNGFLTFGTPLQETDEIRARYKFQYFPDSALRDYLVLAMQDANNYPPSSNYTLENAPDDWQYFIATNAYVMALEALRMDLQMWDTRLAFPDPAQALAAIDARVSAVASQRDANLRRIKGLRTLQPVSVSSGRMRAPNTPADTSLQQYAVLRF